MTATAPPALPRTNGIPPKPADTGVSPLPDLTTLPDGALALLAEQAAAEILRRKEKKEADFLAMVAETAKTLGLAPARVAAAISSKSHRPRPAASGDGRSVVRAKYKSPNGPETWSGRGGAPKWFSDHISAGGKEADMRLPDGQA